MLSYTYIACLAKSLSKMLSYTYIACLAKSLSKMIPITCLRILLNTGLYLTLY